MHRVAEDLWFPNGSVITPDGVLLVDETFGNRVSAFDIAADGSLGPRRDWARFGDLPPRALGEAIPQRSSRRTGAGWTPRARCGSPTAHHPRRPRVREGGEIVDQIDVEGGVFACMLGGDDGRTLFLCTAPDFAEEKRRAAREAKLLSVRVDVPHAGTP